eukprot:SAG25_NODE_1912_length_2151_cov_1.919551_1_plen_135_part_10
MSTVEESTTAEAALSLLDALTPHFAVQVPQVAAPIFDRGAGVLLRANPLCSRTHTAPTAQQVMVPAPSPAGGASTAAPAATTAPSLAAMPPLLESDDEFERRLAITFSLMDKHGTGHVSYVQFLSWWKLQAAAAG